MITNSQKVYKCCVFCLSYYKEVKSTIVLNNTFFSNIFLSAGKCIPSFGNAPRILSWEDSCGYILWYYWGSDLTLFTNDNNNNNNNKNNNYYVQKKWVVEEKSFLELWKDTPSCSTLHCREGIKSPLTPLQDMWQEKKKLLFCWSDQQSVSCFPLKLCMETKSQYPPNSTDINIQPINNGNLDETVSGLYRHKTQEKAKYLTILYCNLSENYIVWTPGEIIAHVDQCVPSKKTEKPIINAVRNGIKSKTVTDQLRKDLHQENS